MEKDCASERTRQLLLRAAKSIFAAKGYHGTSVKELADEAGVNISLVSYHFGGKANLYRACLDQLGQAKLAAATRLLHPPRSLEEVRVRLHLFLEELLMGYIEEPELTKILLRDIELEGSLIEEVFQNRFLRVFKLLLEFLKSARKAALLSQEADLQISAGILFGAVTHLMRIDPINQKYFGFTIKDEAYRKSVLETTIRVFLDGLAPRPSGGRQMEKKRGSK